MNTPTHPHTKRSLTAGLLAAAVLTARLASGAIVGPYAPDPYTLHLYHLDESTTPTLDAVASGTNLTTLSGGATLANTSYSGYGTCLSTLLGGQDSIGGSLQAAVLTPLAVGTPVNFTYADPITGAFTYEALVQIQFDPAHYMTTLGNGGNGRNAQCQIITCENNGSPRVFQFRIDPLGTASAAAFTNRVQIEFIRVGGTSANLYAAIPTNGPDAIVSNNWYHVAVTYNGVPNTTSNLLFYWTLADPTRTNASCIMGTNFGATGLVPTAAASADFTVGNTGRNPSGTTGNPLNANFLGQIDEVRISSVGRAANEMMFADANVYVVRQPVSQLVVAGQPVTFTVGVSGLPQLHYQWFTSGNASTNTISGATASSFTIPSAGTADATNYFVVITNATGAATSSVATLSVRASVDTLTWRGAANANWDLTSLNWSNMNTLANGVIYQSGDNVTIGDGGANYNINLTAGLYPSSLTNSTTNTSSFGGVGFLGGPMNLVKNGTGTFAISNANVFTGTVTVNAGTLRVGNGTALGSTTGGTTINGGATLDLNGQSLGSEPLTVQGNGFGGTNGAINDTGPQQQSAISSLSLAGDTMINATGQRWDFYTNGSSTSFQGHGYKLTKIGANVVYIKDAGDTGLGDVFVSGAGGIGFQGNIGLGDPTKTITCSNSTLNFYATASPLSKNLVLSNSSTLYNGGGTTASLSGAVTFIGTNTVNNANEVDLYGGISGSTGGLTKNGSANLYLYGTNTYPGSTVINGGQVIVGSTGSILAGPVVQLATNATLDVSASPQGLTIGSGKALIGLGGSAIAATVAGNVTNASGSTLNPGLNGPGTLNIGSTLALQGATLPIFLGSDPTQLGNGVNSYINVGGNLDLSGVNAIQITAAGPLTSGPYTILSYSGLLTGAGSFSISSSNPRYTFTLIDPATTPGTIQITNSGVVVPLVWKGGKQPSPNAWDHITTNWLNTVSGAFDWFYDGDVVTFDDTGATNLVNVTQTNKPGLVTVNNSTLAYTFTGAGNLTGTLDKEGTGYLTLTFSNDLGLVWITNNAGTLTLNPPTNSTLNATLLDNGNGTGTFLKAGTNQLTLGGNNASYTGAIAVTNGVLAYGSTASLGGSGSVYVTNNGALNLGTVLANNTGTKNIVISGAGFLGQGAITGGAGGGPTPMMTGTLTLAADATIGGTARWDCGTATGGLGTPVIAANGHTLTKIGSNETWLITIDTTSLANVHIVSGTLGFQQGSSLGDNTKTITVESNATLGFWVNDPTLMDKHIVLTNGATLSSGSGTCTIVGAITLSGLANNTITPASGADISLYGPVGGTGGWVKARTGVVWLYGTNTYSGPTIIGASSKVVVSTNSSLGSSSTIEVDGGSTLDVSAPASFTLGSGQTLIGNGTVIGGNIVFGSGATLQPGFSTSTYTLTMNGSLTFQPGSTNIVKYNKTTSIANDLVTGLNSVTYGGTLLLNNLGANSLSGGDALKIFTAASYPGSFGAIVPATPGPGLAWDTSTLNSDGTLRVLMTVNTARTNIQASVSGNQLTLSWPADHTGWRLLVQTNNLASGISSNTNDWDVVSGSGSVHQEIITINPAKAAEFYKLVYP